jgi:hypothetical protein
MLILLDENLLSQKLKQPFLDAGHSISNVYDMGWRGLKDREILDRSESYPFDVLITADKNLPYQQNLAKRSSYNGNGSSSYNCEWRVYRRNSRSRALWSLFS